ncbi:MAG TPA: hypothetical protein VG603_16340, partial [Chitinophagales bacterium]|nr:hypothetical protein [Chitinophagales bacterium]
TELADKIMDERRVQNQKIMDAFKNYFDFCKVYFIYAKNTKELLAGRQDIFLNDTLGLDTTIRMKENYYLIAEYGDITSNMRTDEYHYSGVYHTEPSTNTASTSVIFLSDTSLTQLKEPFPFYTEVYLDNYNKAVFNLSKSIAKAYISFLAKEDEKRLREKLKEDANSQPH